MGRLPMPTADDLGTFDRVTRAKKAQRRTSLESVRTGVAQAYETYVRVAPHLDGMMSIPVSLPQRDALLHAYDSPTAAFKRLRANLLDGVVRCPFCDISEASTLDHYLPKEKFPEFAIFSRNLVPCCSPCNERKGALTGRPVLHPYFDDAQVEQCLALRVRFAAPDLVLTYDVERPRDMGPDEFAVVEAHFANLDLARRFNLWALDDLRSIAGVLGATYAIGEDATAVRTELQSAANYSGRRYWCALLYRQLGDLPDFCNGGFSVLKR